MSPSLISVLSVALFLLATSTGKCKFPRPPSPPFPPPHIHPTAHLPDTPAQYMLPIYFPLFPLHTGMGTGQLMHVFPACGCNSNRPEQAYLSAQ